MMENLSDPALEERKGIIAENLAVIRQKIAKAAALSGRRPEDIILLAATKTVPAPLICHAVEAGVTHIGENRVQELTEKYSVVSQTGVIQHFIGHLQTNKVNKVIGRVDMIESVSSLKTAAEISRASQKLGLITPVLIEINIGNESSKSGIAVKEADIFLEDAAKLPNIQVKGLMSVPPICQDITEARKFFEKLRKLFIDISAKKVDNVDMVYLSMGMSADYDIAIEEGANIVRIGSALFGSRNK